MPPVLNDTWFTRIDRDRCEDVSDSKDFNRGPFLKMRVQLNQMAKLLCVLLVPICVSE